jgi:hypothetical protein
MRYQTIPPALEANCPSPVRPASSGLRLVVAVLYETITIHRRYERLKRSGLSDATAIRQAFFGRHDREDGHEGCPLSHADHGMGLRRALLSDIRGHAQGAAGEPGETGSALAGITAG